jgi:hypothetical protein
MVSVIDVPGGLTYARLDHEITPSESHSLIKFNEPMNPDDA